jgi:hypothetical protein
VLLTVVESHVGGFISMSLRIVKQHLYQPCLVVQSIFFTSEALRPEAVWVLLKFGPRVVGRQLFAAGS